MIYKFKFKVVGDVIMLVLGGDVVLCFIGKELVFKGIIESVDMLVVMKVIEQVVVVDEVVCKNFDFDEEIQFGKGDGVILCQCVWLLLEMMKCLYVVGVDIVWGV